MEKEIDKRVELEAVGYVSSKVDEVAKTIGDDELSNTNGLKGLLFVGNGENKDSQLTAHDFYGICGSLCGEFLIKLAAVGVTSGINFSPHEETNGHAFLTTVRNGVMVIVDPSIGQFIDGYRGIFVGTRDQLRDIVVNQSGVGKKYDIVNTKSSNDPTEAFERIWGLKSYTP